MCGIAGYVNLDDSPADKSLVVRMVTALKHRGPDAQTAYVDGPVGFGHARLSIIDLEGGHQPLFNEDRTISVICNGEIYNYRELRSQLLQHGHSFRTGSDCEVLVHLWEDLGSNMVDELRGMFAFVLYDRRQGTVFGARDRFGQKPLYYHEGRKSFSFASEIKGLLVAPDVPRTLNPLALDQFLFHQFIPQPLTLFDGVKKLPAGCCFELKLPTNRENLPSDDSGVHAVDHTDGYLRVRQSKHRFLLKRVMMESSFSMDRYWHPTFDPDEHQSTNQHLTDVETALNDSVRSHMVSDVPVGVFLSGGIDSSLITALAAQHYGEPLQTFSISFPGSKHDEGPYAREVANVLGTRHHEFPFQPGDAQNSLTEAATLFDQPLADSAVLPLMSLSRSAADHIKVVLTGDGGDELFAGYRKYQRMAQIPGRYGWLSQISSNLFPMNELAACVPDPYGMRKMRTRLAMAIAPSCRSEYHRQGWEGWERFALYQPELAQSIDGRFDSLRSPGYTTTEQLTPLNAALQLDQETVLADRLLLKGDCATMAYGLEARAPLLDHRLAAVAGKLPLHLKVTSSKTKVALRKIANRYLPDSIISRRKKGFSMPLDRWFRHELRDWTRSCLLDDSVSLPRYFRSSAIKQLLNEHIAGKNHANRIHTLLTFELWCRVYAA